MSGQIRQNNFAKEGHFISHFYGCSQLRFRKGEFGFCSQKGWVVSFPSNCFQLFQEEAKNMCEIFAQELLIESKGPDKMYVNIDLLGNPADKMPNFLQKYLWSNCWILPF